MNTLSNVTPTFKSNVEAGLVKYPKARRIAVENVTYGVRPADQDMAWRMNFAADCSMYSWNSQTIACINWVIKENAKVPQEA
jgi:hypothetical protein